MKKSVFAAFSVAMLLAACSPATQEPTADEAMDGEHMMDDGTMMKDDAMKADDAMVEGEAEMEAGVRVMQEEEVE